jgi:hypothetical protein
MATMTELARRAVPFGLPTVDLHRILVNFALDPTSPEYKGPLNTVHHDGLPDPSDVSVVAPNVDTPYSWAWLDLRGGPVLLDLPAHTPNRYVSTQIVDLYTNIVGYVSPRTTGNSGGRFVVRGPSGGDIVWVSSGVFECPTDLALVLVRTQLFGEGDHAAVRAVQEQVTITPLGHAPPLPVSVPTVDVRTSLGRGFLLALNWMLQLMPALPEDARIREDLTGLGLDVGLLDVVLAEPMTAAEVHQGLGLGQQDVRDRCGTARSSAELFGSREFFAGDYLTRAAGAYLGILGNAAEEYLGVGYQGDAAGEAFDGTHRYAITFASGALPPVDAFWSITVYDDKGHLYPNDLHRHTLGSRQLPELLRGDDGAVTLLVQHEDPGPALRPNWLPCPPGRFGLTFRTYLPREPIRDSTWTAPPVRRLDEPPEGSPA